MATRNTKQKIILASIQLFNQAGVPNVRLQQIADASGISVGNLAYHYKNKEAIIIAALEYVYENSKVLSTPIRIEPGFQDFNLKITAYFETINQYAFLWKDLEDLRREFQEEIIPHRESITVCVDSIYRFLDYNRSEGFLHQEVVDRQYQHLAKVIWMLIAFWVQQRLFVEKEVKDLKAFKRMVWKTVFPFLTEKGMQAYKALEE